MHHRFVRISIILSCFFLFTLLFTGGAFFYLQSKETTVPLRVPTPVPSAQLFAPPATWKTYENKTFLYSFRYPSDVTITPLDKPTGSVTEVCCILVLRGKIPLFQLRVIAEEKTLAENKEMLLTQNSAYVSEMQETTFANKPALSFRYTSEKTINVIDTEKKLRYSIGYTRQQEERSDQILATFRFGN